MVFRRIHDIVNLDGVIIKGMYGAWAFPNSLRQFFAFMDQQFVDRDNHFFQTSLFVYSYLAKVAFDKDWIIVEKDPTLYRRVPASGGGSDPRSVAGALACGGRFNIGAAQTGPIAKKKMPGLANPRTAHYTSQDRRTARREYGDDDIPGSTAVTYKLTLKKRKQLRLIDADKAVKDLSIYIPSLSEIIQSGRIGGTYCDVKKVIPTQLFAHWLMKHCPLKRVDGIRFTSQADPGKYNYCLYIVDDRECKKIFSARKVN